MSLLREAIRLLVIVLTIVLFTHQFGQQLCAQQAVLIRTIDADREGAVNLLEKLVNINSGTFNSAGIAEVGKVLENEFQALGFSTRWLPMDDVKRAPYLIAEHRGHRGKKVLLIGHMDTVFEPTHSFQKFVRSGNTAVGPGVADMKGGIVVILTALKALKAVGALDDSNVKVFLTSDEESVGEPIEISRKEMVEAAKNSDVVLSFEPLLTQSGTDYVITARRGGTVWELSIRAKSGHSSQIFSPSIGDGAVFELSRILTSFHDELREPNLTYNVGLILGGSDIKVEPNGQASVSGKWNIVPGDARAIGDIRALTPFQLTHIKEKMQSIVSRSLPGTSADIQFTDKYPPMAPTAGNLALLTKLNEINHALELPDEKASDPMSRGVGDASFVAPYAEVLDALGAPGTGVHASGESIDLARLPLQSKRAALLIDSLIH
jgi:glutamate carboxypeptidase